MIINKLLKAISLGHAVYFEQCKEFCEILIVVVGRDLPIKKLKGPSRPINPENNRLFLVAAMEPVNFAILGEEEFMPGKIDYYHIAKTIKPDVLILNDDDSAIKEKTEFCKQIGTQIKLVKRTVPDFLTKTSSTDIINKISRTKDS